MIEIVEIHKAGRRDGSVVAEAAAEAAAEVAAVVSVVVAEAAEVAAVVSVVVAEAVVDTARRAGEGRADEVHAAGAHAISAATPSKSLTIKTSISCGTTWMIAKRSLGTARAARARNTSAGSLLP